MKTLKVVLAFLLLSVAAKAESYRPGDWGELNIPKNILTHSDYVRYEQTRKTTKTVAVLSGVAAVVLLKYSSDMKRKARRVQVTESTLFVPTTGYSYYPSRQSSVDFRNRMLSKSSGARQAAVVAGLASLFLAGLTVSISF